MAFKNYLQDMFWIQCCRKILFIFIWIVAGVLNLWINWGLYLLEVFDLVEIKKFLDHISIKFEPKKLHS